MEIQIERQKMLSVSVERKLLSDALDKNCNATDIRLRLAQIHYHCDNFDEAIDLLSCPESGGCGFEGRLILIGALFARNQAGDDDLAEDICANALQLALTNTQHARVLAEVAKAKLRKGNSTAAMELLQQALDLDAKNISAFKRLALQYLRQGEPEKVITLCDGMLKRGIRHSRLFAARMMALAMLQKTDEAVGLAQLDVFLNEAMIEPPADWGPLASFNAALSAEILNNPDLRFGRHGTSSKDAWRVDAPALGECPAVKALLAVISDMAKAHIHTIGLHRHIWSDAVPEQLELRSWSVITQDEGRELWHMHPNGWLSGGYYVEVPEAVELGTDEAGCLAFGLPEGLIGKDAADAYGATLIRPKAGLLTLFPSHSFHRTFPHKSVGRRICLAFDLCPV